MSQLSDPKVKLVNTITTNTGCLFLKITQSQMEYNKTNHVLTDIFYIPIEPNPHIRKCHTGDNLKVAMGGRFAFQMTGISMRETFRLLKIKEHLQPFVAIFSFSFFTNISLTYFKI